MMGEISEMKARAKANARRERQLRLHDINLKRACQLIGSTAAALARNKGRVALAAWGRSAVSANSKSVKKKKSPGAWEAGA
jgi:hypothetical protein